MKSNTILYLEYWLDIPNYNGYQVSTLGNVRTYNKTTNTKLHGIRKWQNRILKPKETHPRSHSKHQGKDGKGYAVDLWKNGKHKTLLVARLVAFTFFNKDINDCKLTVNHKDGNRLNNHIDNLEIISLADNIRHAYATGLMPIKKIKIKNKISGEESIIVGMAKSSLFINKNRGYISGCIKKNVLENEKYEWELL